MALKMTMSNVLHFHVQMLPASATHPLRPSADSYPAEPRMSLQIEDLAEMHKELGSRRKALTADVLQLMDQIQAESKAAATFTSQSAALASHLDSERVRALPYRIRHRV